MKTIIARKGKTYEVTTNAFGVDVYELRGEQKGKRIIEHQKMLFMGKVSELPVDLKWVESFIDA